MYKADGFGRLSVDPEALVRGKMLQALHHVVVACVGIDDGRACGESPEEPVLLFGDSVVETQIGGLLTAVERATGIPPVFNIVVQIGAV